MAGQETSAQTLREPEQAPAPTGEACETQPLLSGEAERHEQYSGEEDDALRQSLGDVAVRHGFIRKVYGIVGVQLLVTTVVGGMVMNIAVPLVKQRPAVAQALLLTSMIVSIAMLCIFMCKPETMQKSPTNYAILLGFTVAESVLVGFICARYTAVSVLAVLGITTFVVLALTIFACQTKVDFTGFGPYLFVALMVLCGFSFAMFIVQLCGLGGSPQFQMLRMVYAACGALLFSMYIVYDTQLIVGGRHVKYQFGVDDYAMAAICLYLDIIQLFLFLLQLFGDRR